MSAQIYAVVNDKDEAYVCVPLEEKPKGQKEEEKNQSRAQRVWSCLLLWVLVILFMRLVHHGGCYMARLHEEQFLAEGQYEPLNPCSTSSAAVAYPNEIEGGVRGFPPAAIEVDRTDSDTGMFSYFPFYEFSTLYIFQEPEPQLQSDSNTVDGAPVEVSEPSFVYVRMRVFLAEDLSY